MLINKTKAKLTQEGKMRVLFRQELSPVDPLKQNCGESTEEMLEALLAVTLLTENAGVLLY